MKFIFKKWLFPSFQPKRKKRGRPAKNAKNEDEESENSQNLPPALADETSVVNDNKSQVQKNSFLEVYRVSKMGWGHFNELLKIPSHTSLKSKFANFWVTLTRTIYSESSWDALSKSGVVLCIANNVMATRTTRFKYSDLNFNFSNDFVV